MKRSIRVPLDLKRALAGCVLCLGLMFPAPAPAGEGSGSLFAQLIGPGGEIPFPIGRLLERIRAELAPGADVDSLPLVLIPLGRSLQRHAAGDADYFRYPRVVVAVSGEPRDIDAPLLRDRLYLGYHEKAGVLEVISYNPARGRFEFEVADDYRAGGKARLKAGNRALCLACHQNAAPIFSRQTWDETSANRSIAALLELTGKDFYGLDWRRGIDVANAIDDATDRANLLSVAQRVWREGCGSGEAALRCRARLLWLTLRSRLSGVPVADKESAHPDLAPLASAWAGVWREGLALPSPDLPNRLPFTAPPTGSLPPTGAEQLRRAADVAAAFDALALRPPLEVWRPDQRGRLARIVQALGLFVSATDARALEAALAARTNHPVRADALDCQRDPRGERVDLSCASDDGATLTARMSAGRLRIDRLVLASGEVRYGLDLMAHDDGFVPRGVAPRAASGEALSRVSVAGDRLLMHFVDDLGGLREAIAAMTAPGHAGHAALATAPLRRRAVLSPLLASLGAPAPQSDEPAALASTAEPVGGGPADGELALFQRFCGACHDSDDAFPPGFLRGDASHVRARVDRCAPRMLQRIAMWDQPADARSKTPMPPPASPQAVALRASPQLGAMRSWLDARLRTLGQNPAELLQHRYADLPDCSIY